MTRPSALVRVDNTTAPHGLLAEHGLAVLLAVASVHRPGALGGQAWLQGRAGVRLSSRAVCRGGVARCFALDNVPEVGFADVAAETEDDDLPQWARGNAPSEVMEEGRAAIAQGCRVCEMRCRLMLPMPMRG